MIGRSAGEILRRDVRGWNEFIIERLRSIRFNESAIYEDVIGDYMILSGRVLPLESESSEAVETFRQEYEISITRCAVKLSAEVEEQRLQSIQLERENENLRNESKLKSLVFQNEIRERITEEKAMPFLRFTIPRDTLNCIFNNNTSILAHCDGEQPHLRLFVSSLENRQISPISRPIFQTSLRNNKQNNTKYEAFMAQTSNILVLSVPNSLNFEIWQMSPTSKIADVPAHSEPITFIHLLEEMEEFKGQIIVISQSIRSILKIWKVEINQNNSFKLLDVNRFDPKKSISCCKNIPNKNLNPRIVAGMFDGSIKIFELVISSDSAKLNLLQSVQLSSPAGIPVISLFCEYSNLNAVTIAATLLQDDKNIDNSFTNIFIIFMQREKVFSLKNSISVKFPFQKFQLGKNSPAHQTYILTPDYLVAGSTDGRVLTWNIKDLSHPLTFHTPSITFVKSSPTISESPIVFLEYSIQADSLLTVDKIGNILKWSNFISGATKPSV